MFEIFLIIISSFLKFNQEKEKETKTYVTLFTSNSNGCISNSSSREGSFN